MAEAAVLAALGWLVSPIITKFINRTSTYLTKDLARELQELEDTVLPQFQLVIAAAEKSPFRAELEGWLSKLKAAFHEAKDLLAKHENDILKREAEKKSTQASSSVLASSSNAVLKPLRAASNKVSNLRSKNRKLIRKLEELKKILAEAKNFHDLLSIHAEAGNGSDHVVRALIRPHTDTTSLSASKDVGLHLAQT
ncbi:hypothetical protein E2562_016950 [Oryza meyeriana var. granulata]|uniref:Rx N-terminal domain-containing protein n=1 Tax=Oryza meyeriana var. granulata TaxID=110450 RepID=A0A6G1DZN1_9ORYZ|nr:hypothetical protein E2562_016950 [Oryza meyeriana var. granulata]